MYGPYESAVSMRSTPSSTARRSTRTHSSRSRGSPQIPLPVSCIAPYPSRCTSRSPPILNVPLASTGLISMGGPFSGVSTSGSLPAGRRLNTHGSDRRRRSGSGGELLHERWWSAGVDEFPEPGDVQVVDVDEVLVPFDVVPAAQQDQVVEVGGGAVEPGLQVVGV